MKQKDNKHMYNSEQGGKHPLAGQNIQQLSILQALSTGKYLNVNQCMLDAGFA